MVAQKGLMSSKNCKKFEHFTKRNTIQEENKHSILPVWQWSPVNPTKQEQVYPFTSSLHVAELLHGDEKHSFISKILQRERLVYLWQMKLDEN